MKIKGTNSSINFLFNNFLRESWHQLLEVVTGLRFETFLDRIPNFDSHKSNIKLPIIGSYFWREMHLSELRSFTKQCATENDSPRFTATESSCVLNHLHALKQQGE